MGTKLSELQKKELLELLLKNYNAFQLDSDSMGKTKLATHSIPTGNAKPIVTKQYQIPSACKENLNEQVINMEKSGVIRKSNSPWRSPVLLVKKKSTDGSIVYRFCIDLKKVNSVTVKDCYALPLISETVNALSGCSFFTTLDVDKAFWQIPVKGGRQMQISFRGRRQII